MPAGTKPGYHIGRAGGLTERERQVMEMLMAGVTVKEAADRLGVRKQRADQIVRSLIDKGVMTRTPTQFTFIIVVDRGSRE